MEEKDDTNGAREPNATARPPPVVTTLTSLTAHHKLLLDPTTKEPVTYDSDLAELYKPWGKDIDNTLLRNLTGVSEPHVTCSLITKNGTKYPPNEDNDDCGYKLRFAFNKLLYAPCVRLECTFPKHTIILEFHFNKCNSTQLTDFQWVRKGAEESHDIVSFNAKGATFEGYPALLASLPTLSNEQKAVCAALRAIMDTTESEPLKFRLNVADLDTEDLEELYKMQSLLPGGDGVTLPSLGVEEYSCFPQDFGQGMSLLRKPYNLISGGQPPPMVSLQAGDTFTSLRDFSVQHTIATIMEHWEGQTTLRQFARGKHEVTIFNSGEYAVIAMNFRELPNQDTSAKQRKMRLPRELEIDITFEVPGMGMREFKAHLESQPLGLPEHDAFFIIADHTPMWFGDKANDVYRALWYSEVFELLPHLNSFLLDSQRKAIEKITTISYEHWHPILLNQRHDQIEEIDVTAGIDVRPDVLADALKWLRQCKPWNEQQLKVIDSIHRAKGRLCLCSGIAGSGKSTLQIALAIFCVKLGGKAVVTGTANTNADATVNGIEEFEDVVAEKKLRVYRIYTGARKVRLQDISAEQSSQRRAGHQGGNVSNLNALRFEMMAKKKKKIGAIDKSLMQGVLDEAEKRELSYPCKMAWLEDPLKEVDAWDAFRECLEADRKGEFDWKDEDSREKYHSSFEKCKRHLLSLTDIIVLTNGNIRCGEAQTWSEECENVKFLAILCDEVAKEQEVNILNVVTSKLPRRPDLYVFFGDERQLEPVNACAKGLVEFNPFNKRLDTSLFTRLVRQGFPYVFLTEQERMHPCLSRFPSKEFYDGALTDSPKVHRQLEAVRPGLAGALHEIIAASIPSIGARAKYLENATDEQARLHYLEMPEGVARIDKNLSKAVPEHIAIFFDQIMPGLQAFFGEKMEDEVMLITAHSHALKLYEKRIYELKKQQQLSPSHYPKAMTIDSGQGAEATMVIVDGSMQFSELGGFMGDRGRSNAAMTRARDVLWILGGPLHPKRNEEHLTCRAPFVELKRELHSTGQVHRFQKEDVFKVGQDDDEKKVNGFPGGRFSRRRRYWSSRT